jgi:NAD(P)-dependent dehydrogenase (short-subunit alcohol dehydrogenase family)
VRAFGGNIVHQDQLRRPLSPRFFPVSFYVSQQVIPQMKKQNSGHVVNISAVLADQPSGAVPALLAVLSKSPMPAVSKALALEYAANNIRFNTVSAGNINTPMHAKDNHVALVEVSSARSDG